MAAASTRARRGVLVARVVVEVSKGSGPVIGEMAAVWALSVGEHANLPDGLGGVLGDGGARTERGGRLTAAQPKAKGC